ncbi:MAG: zinc-ribbon domain containing protein [Patescibacteria group bacterium]|nr:zinc-ribbon domain containing protein [Patescibacteria group bacterium]
MESGDKIITCTEQGCGQQFTFTKGEQDFYTQKGFPEPKRCPDCRKVARRRYDEKREKIGQEQGRSERSKSW